MVKMVRLPRMSRAELRNTFGLTANAISGWVDGIKYTPSEIKRRKRLKIRLKTSDTPATLPPRPVEKIDITNDLFAF